MNIKKPLTTLLTISAFLTPSYLNYYYASQATQRQSKDPDAKDPAAPDLREPPINIQEKQGKQEGNNALQCIQDAPLTARPLRAHTQLD